MEIFHTLDKAEASSLGTQLESLTWVAGTQVPDPLAWFPAWGCVGSLVAGTPTRH